MNFPCPRAAAYLLLTIRQKMPIEKTEPAMLHHRAVRVGRGFIGNAQISTGTVMATRIDILEDVEGFAALAPAWRRLHAAARGGPFSSPEWIAAWIATYADTPVRPVIATAWRDGEIVAALPLGLRRRRLVSGTLPVTVLEMLCDARAGFHDVLVAPGHEDVVAQLTAALRSGGRCSAIDLSPLAKTPGTVALAAAAEAQGLRLRRREEIRSAVSDLSGGWEAFLQRRSREFRKSLRVNHRKLEQREHAFHSARAPGPEADRVLSGLLDLSARCWKARMGTDIGSEPRTRRFIEALWHHMAPHGTITVNLLVIDGQEAASYLALEDEESVYGMITDFDEAFREFSPGRLIVAAGFMEAAARGRQRADNLRYTPFTERFADSSYTFERLRLCPRNGPADLLLGAAERLRPIGSEARRWWRRRSRKRIAYKDKVN